MAYNVVEMLDAISETTGVNFASQYYEPSRTSRDYFPAPLHSTTPGTSRFVVLPPDGRTAETQGDVAAAIADLRVLSVQIRR